MKDIVRQSAMIQWWTNPQPVASVFEGSFFYRWLKDFLLRFGRVRLFSDDLSQRLGRWLLMGLLYSVFFAPRFAVGSIAGSFPVDLRIDDIILLMLLVLFFLKKGRQENFQVIWIEKSFLFFLMACMLSIANGLWNRTIDKPLLSFFYLSKWVEYFLVFVITTRFVRDRQDAVFFIRGFFVLGLAIAAYGYWEYLFPGSKAVYPNYYRLYERPPPFTGMRIISEVFLFYG